MFKLDSVFLFALDVVKGPYVHCSAPQGNGVAADVLAVATPLHPTTPVTWEMPNAPSSKASTFTVSDIHARPEAAHTPHTPHAHPTRSTESDTQAATTTTASYTLAGRDTESGKTHARRHVPPPPPITTTTTPTTAATVTSQRGHDGERGDASADSRFAGLSDVFIPRSEFSRRVLWLYPAETRSLYLYYPEEIPGDHYPRKTLRYSLCMSFRVDPRMVTVGNHLLNRLVQPYSTVLMNVAEELRHAEIRYSYVSRGLETRGEGRAAATSRTAAASSPAQHASADATTAAQSSLPHQSAGQQSGLALASTVSSPTLWTAASASSTTSSEQRCLNAFVTPNLEQRWVSLQEFFNAWYASMAPDITPTAARRAPSARQGRVGRSPARRGGVGGVGDAASVSARAKSSGHAEDGAVGRCTTAAFTLSPTLAAAKVSAAHANTLPSFLPRYASSGSGIYSVARGSVDTMASTGVDMESTVYSPLVTHPRDTHASSWDRLARAAVAAAVAKTQTARTKMASDTSGTTSDADHATGDNAPAMARTNQNSSGHTSVADASVAARTAALSAGPHDGNTRRVIEVLSILQSRWQLIQRLVSASSSTGHSNAWATHTAAAAATSATAPVTRSPVSFNRHSSAMLHLSDGIGFHVRRMAPETPVKDVPLGFIPVLITTPDARQMEKMDMAVQRVLQLVDGERSVADIVFQLTFNTASTLYEVCHAAATQSPQLFATVPEQVGTASGGGVTGLHAHGSGTANALAAFPTGKCSVMRTAMVIPGSETTTRVASGTTHTHGTTSTSPFHRRGQAASFGVFAAEGSSMPPPTSAATSSGASLDTAADGQSGRAAHGTQDATTHATPASGAASAPPLCVSSMLVQLRRMPRASALFTRWAPTPIARVTVSHTAPRTLLEATQEAYRISSTANTVHKQHAGHATRADGGASWEERLDAGPRSGVAGESSALFRTVLQVPSPSWLPSAAGNRVSPLDPHATSAAAPLAARTGRLAATPPLHLGADGGHSRQSHGTPQTMTPTAATGHPTYGTSPLTALPRAASAVDGVAATGGSGVSADETELAAGREAFPSALTLPTVDVVRVAVDLPPIWQNYLGCVTEALLQLERCGMVRLLQPWAPHTAYRTTPRFQDVLVDRQHPARDVIGLYLLKCARRSRRNRLACRHHLHRRLFGTHDAVPGDQQGMAPPSANGAHPLKPLRRTAAADNTDGGEVANATSARAAGPHDLLMPAEPTATSSATAGVRPSTTAVGPLKRATGARRSVAADLDDSVRSGYSSGGASLLSHALSYDATGGTLRLNLARSLAATGLLAAAGGGGGTATGAGGVPAHTASSHSGSPTMVISGSLGHHFTSLYSDDAFSTSTSPRLGPLGHTLLPDPEPVFLTHSLPKMDLGAEGSAHSLPYRRRSGGATSLGDVTALWGVKEHERLGGFEGGDGALSLPRSSSASLESTSSVSSYASLADSASSSEDDKDVEDDSALGEAASPARAKEASDQAAPSDALAAREASPVDDALTHFSEADIRATASAALCAIGKFTNVTIRRVQQEMRWMPAWSRALDGWSPQCCRALVELALVNDWLEVVQ